MRHGEHKSGVLGDHVHKEKSLNYLDKLVALISILFPFTAIPQIIEIWIVQDVSGVSLLTWVLFALFTIPLLLYGIVHRIKPWAIMNTIWMIMYAIIIAGLIIFA